MEETNVNNLNGIPNFGHGLPADGIVIAGVTDVPQVDTLDDLPSENMDENHEEGKEDVSQTEGAEEKDNG